jgi:hypothetical protein
MNKKLILSIFVPLMIAFIIPKAIASDRIDDVFSSAVYLRQGVVKSINLNGKQYEVWLKEPTQEKYEPFLEYSSGSGFFVVVDNIHPYLITAQHVANQMTRTAKAVIRGANDTPITIALCDFVSGSKLEWIIHDHADVAALPITTLDKKILNILQRHFLSLDVLVKDLNPPSRDIEFVTIGFPLNLGIEAKFSPISRSSKSASGLLELPRFDTKKSTTFFLLEDPSVGGFSGSPVYDLPGTQLRGNALVFKKGLKCYGIVHGTLSDNTGGKFTAVVPSAFIVETINKAEKTWPSTGYKQGQPAAARDR